jgi:hypothetical protein
VTLDAKVTERHPANAAHPRAWAAKFRP